jgi:hypothetical protein
MQMNYPVYSVVSINRRWFADCDDTRHGPYTSADTATLVASSEARACRHNARAVKIIVHDESGTVLNEFFVRPEPKAACK